MAGERFAWTASKPSMHDPFPPRTWDDLRHAVVRTLNYRFGHYNTNNPLHSEDVEDAASTALMYVVARWRFVPSSLSDDAQRNWAFAVSYARKVANTALYQRASQLSGEEIRFTDYAHTHQAAGSGGGEGDGHPIPLDFAEPEPDPPMPPSFQEFLDSLTEQELREFAEPVMAGMSEREQAREMGVSQPTVHRRRVRHRDELKRKAYSMGLGRGHAS